MSTEGQTQKGYLRPDERFAEIIFGLVMTLSITGTMSVARGGTEDVGVMLWAVLGCNIAWGIIDGMLYLLLAVSEKGRGYSLYRLVTRTKDQRQAQTVIAEELPPVVAGVLTTEELETIRQRLASLPDQPGVKMITRDEIGGTIAVFFFVVLSCIPVLIPFVLIHEPLPALRTSNAVAIVMLYLGGHALARYAGLSKFKTGITMVVLGMAMVGLTIALGG